MSAKIKIVSQRRLAAVLGAGGTGLFLRDKTTEKSVYVDLLSNAMREEGLSLESLLDHGGRTPIYEGDVVEIQF